MKMDVLVTGPPGVGVESDVGMMGGGVGGVGGDVVDVDGELGFGVVEEVGVVDGLEMGGEVGLVVVVVVMVVVEVGLVVVEEEGGVGVVVVELVSGGGGGTEGK